MAAVAAVAAAAAAGGLWDRRRCRICTTSSSRSSNNNGECSLASARFARLAMGCCSDRRCLVSLYSLLPSLPLSILRCFIAAAASAPLLRSPLAAAEYAYDAAAAAAAVAAAQQQQQPQQQQQQPFQQPFQQQQQEQQEQQEQQPSPSRQPMRRGSVISAYLQVSRRRTLLFFLLSSLSLGQRRRCLVPWRALCRLHRQSSRDPQLTLPPSTSLPLSVYLSNLISRTVQKQARGPRSSPAGARNGGSSLRFR